MTDGSTDRAASRIVVFAVGNESRGDDALGPLLLRALSERLPASDTTANVTFIEDFQLQVEHGLDLAATSLVLFIDAAIPPAIAADQPFSLSPLHMAERMRSFSHALHPGEVLWAAHAAGIQPLPEAWVLAVRGQRFELGEGLSVDAKEHMQAALTAITPWLMERALSKS